MSGLSVDRILVLAIMVAVVPLLLVLFLVPERPPERMDIHRSILVGLLEHAAAFEVPFRAVELRCDRQAVYVYNASDQCIVAFDKNGNIKRKWGRKGRAQGEFQMIAGWDVDSAGIRVVDARNLTITEMDLLARLTLHQSLRAMFFRASPMGNRKYVFRMMNPASPKRQQFRVFDIDADSTYELNVTMPRVENDLSLDGVFLRGCNNRLFYVCQWAGYFLAFDREGKQLYLAQTIDKSAPPEILEQGMRIDPTATLINISASASDRYLYILSRATSRDDTVKEYVDMYDVSTAAYHGSFTIPHYNSAHASAIAASEEGIYAIQGQWITYYRFREID